MRPDRRQSRDPRIRRDAAWDDFDAKRDMAWARGDPNPYVRLVAFVSDVVAGRDFTWGHRDRSVMVRSAAAGATSPTQEPTTGEEE